ncbi:MAG: magnesium transporter [Akkermansiaceae bacterium]|nr:magnesium transporter [Armatimonadota bacterium]
MFLESTLQFDTVALTERLRNALKTPPGDGGDLAMTATLRGRHPADIAEAMEGLAKPEALFVFNWLDNARAAEVLDEVDSELSRYIVNNAPPGRIAELLDTLPMDDAAELIEEAQANNPERAEELLEELATRSPEDAAEVRELLSYDDKTAGRLMTDKFVRLSGTMSVEDAFTAIRRSDPDVETLADLYVTDGGRKGREKLIGVLSLRDLVRAKPNARISQVMVPEPIAVSVDTDQEEVAQTISKYDFSAIPVLDRDGYLVGIVTVDDVVDVLVEEQTEDALKQGAVSSEAMNMPYFSVPIWTVVRSRVPWLAMLFVASMLTTVVLEENQSELDRVPVLSLFFTLLVGTGGNAGAQTISTVIRGMSLGEIRGRDAMRVLWREFGTGFMLGGLLAVVAFVRAYLMEKRIDFALVVALTVWAICAWSNVIASMIPLAAQRLKIDPALVSSPLITTLVDASGLFIYLMIAKALLAELR